jgi:Rhodopirellula transposase DDE domain
MAGPIYRPKGDPRRVNAHDFENTTLGKVAPYGVYDMTANTGFVSVGVTSDTAEFAVQAIMFCGWFSMSISKGD